MTDENSEIDKIIKVVIHEYKNNDNDNAENMFKIILEKLGIDGKQYKQSDYKLKYKDKLSVINSKLLKLDYKSSDDKSSDDAAKYINLILTIKQEDQEKHLKSRFPELELGNNTADKFPPPDVDDNTDATRRELSKLAIPDDKEEEEEKSNQASKAVFAKKLVAEQAREQKRQALRERQAVRVRLEREEKRRAEEAKVAKSEKEDEERENNRIAASQKYREFILSKPLFQPTSDSRPPSTENSNNNDDYSKYNDAMSEIPLPENNNSPLEKGTPGTAALEEMVKKFADSPDAKPASNDEKRMVEERVKFAKKPSDRKYERKYAWTKTPSQAETPSQPYLGSSSRSPNYYSQAGPRLDSRSNSSDKWAWQRGEESAYQTVLRKTQESDKKGNPTGKPPTMFSPRGIMGGTLKRRKPKKKISRKKYYKVARNTKRKLNKKNKNTRKIYT
tara:strand:- start:89 stop:1429 length:1341 start_codon:yes stop_codon:yes gene_type:complete